MKILRKIVSVIVCVTLLVCITNSDAVTAEAALNESYLQINQKICKELENGVLPEMVFENLSESEIGILMNTYDSNQDKQNYGFSAEVANSSEVRQIDELANNYYNYYVVQDSVSSSINLYDTILNNSFSEKLAVSSTADYSMFMKDLGYTFTVQQIAAQLVSIGVYMNIGGAMPFLSLAALIVGMGLIAFTAITVAYCGVAVGVNNLILTWYINSSNNLLNARTRTATLVAQKEQGVIYWEAYLVNYEGKGGITITRPVTENEALGIVKINLINPNVFAVSLSAALYLGSKASPQYGIKMDEPHNVAVQPFNLYHVHANTGPGIQGNTHIFYIP